MDGVQRAGRSQLRATEAVGRSQPATNGLGKRCTSSNHTTSAITSDHALTNDHSVGSVTTGAVSLNVHKPGHDVLVLARELAVAAERGDVAEVIRLARVIATCDESARQVAG